MDFVGLRTPDNIKRSVSNNEKSRKDSSNMVQGKTRLTRMSVQEVLGKRDPNMDKDSDKSSLNTDPQKALKTDADSGKKTGDEIVNELGDDMSNSNQMNGHATVEGNKDNEDVIPQMGDNESANLTLQMSGYNQDFMGASRQLD